MNQSEANISVKQQGVGYHTSLIHRFLRLDLCWTFGMLYGLQPVTALDGTYAPTIVL